MEAARMRKKKQAHSREDLSLHLPDRDHAKSLVPNGLSFPHSGATNKFAME
jgi:hypothetical protein